MLCGLHTATVQAQQSALDGGYQRGYTPERNAIRASGYGQKRGAMKSQTDMNPTNDTELDAQLEETQ